MNNIDLLILTGAPGAGKSTVANALSEHLREREGTHAVLELDDLAKIYPLSLQNIMYRNLAAIWPNYVGLGEVKVIMPTYLQSGELEVVKNVAPVKRLSVCEVTVPQEELSRRITDRELDGLRRTRLLEYVGNYAVNRVEEKSIDLRVSTHNFSTEETVIEIVEKLAWPA